MIPLPVEPIDVMQKELWSLPMAAAWLIWRTEGAVRDACPEANGYTKSMDLADIFKKACDSDSAPRMEGAAAQVEFWGAMIERRLHPAGRPRDGYVRLPIPPEEWRKIVFIPPAGQRPDAVGTADETLYGEVVVLRDEVMASWPAPEQTTGTSHDESECTKWLMEFFSQSPNRRTMVNSELLAEAKKKWPHIGDNQFERAKANAVAKTEAKAWARGGRPPKAKT